MNKRCFLLILFTLNCAGNSTLVKAVETEYINLEKHQKESKDLYFDGDLYERENRLKLASLPKYKIKQILRRSDENIAVEMTGTCSGKKVDFDFCMERAKILCSDSWHEPQCTFRSAGEYSAKLERYLKPTGASGFIGLSDDSIEPIPLYVLCCTMAKAEIKMNLPTYYEFGNDDDVGEIPVAIWNNGKTEIRLNAIFDKYALSVDGQSIQAMPIIDDFPQILLPDSSASFSLRVSNFKILMSSLIRQHEAIESDKNNIRKRIPNIAGFAQISSLNKKCSLKLTPYMFDNRLK